MLVDCPICAKSYQVRRSELAGGRALICSRCDASWVVDEDGAPDLAAASIRAPTMAAATFTHAHPTSRRSSLLAGARSVLAGGAVLGLLMTTIGARERIVQTAPRLASVYAIAGLPVVPQGLAFTNVMPARLPSAPSRLAVSGAIHNVATRGMTLPPIVYDIRDAAGVSLLSWTETGRGDVIRPGGTFAFSSAPHSVPDTARVIRVSFEDRHGARISLAATLLQ